MHESSKSGQKKTRKVLDLINGKKEIPTRTLDDTRIDFISICVHSCGIAVAAAAGVTAASRKPNTNTIFFLVHNSGKYLSKAINTPKGSCTMPPPPPSLSFTHTALSVVAHKFRTKIVYVCDFYFLSSTKCRENESHFFRVPFD